MRNTTLLVGTLAAWLAAAGALAEEAAPPAVQEPPAGQEGTKALSGMSVLGNSEAPKSLVIVPWKTSEISDGLGLASLLDERARPVDKEVFARELAFYELRTGELTKRSTQEAGAEESASSP